MNKFYYYENVLTDTIQYLDDKIKSEHNIFFIPNFTGKS